LSRIRASARQIACVPLRGHDTLEFKMVRSCVNGQKVNRINARVLSSIRIATWNILSPGDFVH
jgi:hypothetical protein